MDRQKKERMPIVLFIGVTVLIVTAAYVNVIGPDSLISVLGFFALLSIASMLLGIYVFPHTRHALFLTAGIIVLLVLRFIGLRHPLYIMLLIASIIAMEYLWRDNS